MKKLLLILAFIGASVAAHSQTVNPFPTTDSLRKFVNKWIRNSAVDAFTNLRLNSALISITRFIDDAEGGGGITPSDTAAMLSGYTRLSRFMDSVAALRASISALSPQGPENSLQYRSGGVFAGDAGLTYNATSNTLTTDTLIASKWNGDRAQLSRQFYTYLPTGLEGWGNSFVYGSYATPRTDSGFLYRFGTYMSLSVTNSALSGTGCFYNIKNFHANVGLSNTRFQVINVTYNDLRATGDNVKTYAKGVNAYKAAFCNHFTSAYVDAGGTGVTRSGTWTTGVNATIHAGKSANAAYTSTQNDTITYTFTGTSVIAALMGSDGIVSNYATVDAILDGSLYGTYNSNNQTDGAVVFSNPNHTDSVFCYPILIHGLSNGSHTLKLVNKSSGGKRMFVDYFGTLASPSTKPPLGIFHLIPIQPYYVTFNSKVDSMVTTLPTGFPFAVFEIEDYFVEATDMDVDGVHPNNSGHRHYFNSMQAKFSPILANLPDGILTYDDWLYITSNGTSKQVPHTEDVWTKNNDDIQLAGTLRLRNSKLFPLYQGTTHLISYDPTLNNLRAGPSGNTTQTGSGNIQIGNNASPSSTTGNGSIDIGSSAALNRTTGTGVHIGFFAGAFNTTGINTDIGFSAGQFGAGTNNTRIGVSAGLGNNSFPYNNTTVVGAAGAQGNRANNGVFYGYNTNLGRNITGPKLMLIGYQPGAPIAKAASGDWANIGNFLFADGANGQDTTAAGKVGIVKIDPAVTLHVGGTDAVGINGGTTAQRPTGAAGYIRWNTDSTRFEGYTGAKWVTLLPGDVSTGGSAALTTNYIGVGTAGVLGGSSAYTYDGTTVKQENATAATSITSTTALGSTSGGDVRLFAKATPTAADQRMGGITFGTLDGGSTENITAAIQAFSTAAHTSGTSEQTYMDFFTSATNALARVMRLTANLRVGIRTTTIPGMLTIGGGNASEAPFVLTSGTDMTTPTTGAFQFGSSRLGFVPTGSTIKRFALTNDATPSNGQIPIGNGTDYTAAAITGGPTISVTNGAGSITLAIPTTFITVGTYVPTVSNEVNIDAVTLGTVYYQRTGDAVRVWGNLSINATTVSVSTSFTLTLPISITGGLIAGSFVNGDSRSGRISISSNNAQFLFKPDDTANLAYSFNFEYQVQ